MEQVEFERNLNNFFGSKDDYGTTQSQKRRQTRDEAIRIFFGVVDRQPRISSFITFV